MWNTQTHEKKEETRKQANSVVENIGELNCPYCGKVMTNHEYDHAAQEFKKSSTRIQRTI